MKINNETDYAFRIMRELARKNQITDAGTLASATSIPQRFALKILGKLVLGGLVLSKKGANGGYGLARAAKDITLLDIVEVIDGPIVISKCLSEDFVCAHEDGKSTCDCFFNRVFDEINITIAEKLRSVTVADSI